MAAKSTYMYQVTLAHGNDEPIIAYCYARNASVAVENMKKIYKDKKPDYVAAKLFGEVDIKVHPEPFMPMSKEEVDYISRSQIASAPAYSQRKNVDANPLPAGGEFVPANAISAEGDVV